MQIINIHQAKTQLSKLLEQVLAGEEIVIAKAGKPIAKLVTFKQDLQPRKPGLWKGKVSVPDNFDDESDEINELFYGKK